MAFTSISAEATKASKAITQSLMDLIRTNLDDHEARIAALEASLIVTGFIVGESRTFRGAFLPGGFLFEDGSSVSTVTFADLFAVIGTTYGTTGPGFFNLPDARGRVDAGKDDMDNVVGTGGGLASRLTLAIGKLDGTILGEPGGSGGTEGVILTSTGQLANHVHGPGTLSTTVDSPVHDSSVFPVVELAITNPVTVTGTGGALNHFHPVTTGATASAGGTETHENVQPTLIGNKIIRFLA